MYNFSEWLNNRDKNFYNEIYDVPFNPAMTAGRGGNPVFSRYTGPGETKLPKWMADKGYTSTNRPDNAIFIPAFKVTENEIDKSITISGTKSLQDDLDDQIIGGHNVARIGGEQLLQKKDPNDENEVGDIVYKNAVIFLHDNFGQLKALLSNYLIKNRYEKANLVVVPKVLNYIDSLSKYVPNFRQYAERIINMSIKSVCRDLGLIYDAENYAVTKNTTGKKMPRTERGPSRHESGISTYTGGNIPSDYRTNNY